MRGLALVVALTILPSIARADPEPAAATEATVEPMPYRGGILLGDLMAATFIGGGSAIFLAYQDCDCEEWMSPVIVLMGLGSYFSFSPMVHYEYQHPGRAWLAVGMRALVPTAAGFAGNALGGDTTGTLLSVAGGMLVAAVLDITLLADDHSRPRTTVTTGPASPPASPSSP